MLRILHIAPANYAGVPYQFFRMHNMCGDFSRLITLHKNERAFPEDICLNIPLPRGRLARRWRRGAVAAIQAENPSAAKEFAPRHWAENLYFRGSDALRAPYVRFIRNKFELDRFDVIHFDAGMGFFRFPQDALRWKAMGKKIVTCYYGSDLRVRGYLKQLEDISDLSITSEYDHLSLFPKLRYLFYPFDVSQMPRPEPAPGSRIRIVHSPTNRTYKGTALIISVIEKLQKSFPIEFLLCEHMNRADVLQVKKACHISVDQVGGTMGGTGYGVAGIETLSMGIPTITNMSPEYAEWLPDNPFCVANNAAELEEWLVRLLSSEELRHTLGARGAAWVRAVHGYPAVHAALHALYRERGIT